MENKPELMSPVEVYKIFYKKGNDGTGYIPEWWKDSEFHDVTHSFGIAHDLVEHNPKNTHPNAFAEELRAIGAMAFFRVDGGFLFSDDPKTLPLEENIIGENVIEELIQMITEMGDVEPEYVLENFSSYINYSIIPTESELLTNETCRRFYDIARRMTEDLLESLPSRLKGENIEGKNNNEPWTEDEVAKILGMSSLKELEQVVTIHLINGFEEFKKRFDSPQNGGYQNVHESVFKEIEKQLKELDEEHSFEDMVYGSSSIEIMVHIDPKWRSARCYILKEEFDEYDLYSEEYEHHLDEYWLKEEAKDEGDEKDFADFIETLNPTMQTAFRKEAKFLEKFFRTSA